MRDRFTIKSEIDKLTEAQKKAKFQNYFKKPQPKKAPSPADGEESEQEIEEQKTGEKKASEGLTEAQVEAKPELLTAPENAEMDIGVESKY